MRGQISWLMRVEDHDLVFSDLKLLHVMPVHCHVESAIHGSAIPDVFGGLAPSDTAYLVVVHVNFLAWGSKFLVNKCLHCQSYSYALDARLDLSCFLQSWRGWAFPGRRLLIGFYIVTLNPGFIFSIYGAVFSEFEGKFNADAFSSKSGIRISCLAQ